jgi:hypothetical protein
MHVLYDSNYGTLQKRQNYKVSKKLTEEFGGRKGGMN